jgi:hypothetical protein
MLLRNRRGGFAVQYAFLGDEGLDFMEEHGISKLTVHLLISEAIRRVAVDDSDSG